MCRIRSRVAPAPANQPFTGSVSNANPAARTRPQTPAIHDTSNQPFSASVANATATVVSRPQARPPQAPVQQPFLTAVTSATPTARAHPQTTATHATSSQPFSASIANAASTVVSRPQARSSQAATNQPSLASVANATATTIRLRPETPQAPINEPFQANATPTAVSRPQPSTTHASPAPQAPAYEPHGLCDQRRHLRLHTCGCAYITPPICTLPESVSPHYHPAAPLRSSASTNLTPAVPVPLWPFGQS